MTAGELLDLHGSSFDVAIAWLEGRVDDGDSSSVDEVVDSVTLEMAQRVHSGESKMSVMLEYAKLWYEPQTPQPPVPAVIPKKHQADKGNPKRKMKL